MKKILIPLVLFAFQFSFGQEIQFSGAIEASGIYTGDEAPFWLYTNTNGLRSSLTNSSGYAFAKADYAISDDFQLSAGVGLMFRDGVKDRLQRDQVFVQLDHKWASLIIGSKRNDESFEGLSSTNSNILYSGNARSIPGVLIESPGYLSILPRVGVTYGLGHYVLNDNRFVDDTYVHYKRLGFRVKTTKRSTFDITLQHFVQWGGTSPELGKLPSSFEDFVKVFFAQNAGEEAPTGEVVNALGNHIGSYNINYTYTTDETELSLYHQHLFEDGTGARFRNFPDGVWGITYKPKSNVIKRLLYEFVTTTDQSGFSNNGLDNYFSNSIYRSGWTYEGRTIGLPFLYRNESDLRFTNNSVTAHHFGVSAMHNKWVFKLRTSLVSNKGTLAIPFTPEENDSYTSLTTDYNASWGTLFFIGGIDTSSVNDTNYGAGLGYRYNF